MQDTPQSYKWQMRSITALLLHLHVSRLCMYHFEVGWILSFFVVFLEHATCKSQAATARKMWLPGASQNCTLTSWQCIIWLKTSSWCITKLYTSWRCITWQISKYAKCESLKWRLSVDYCWTYYGSIQYQPIWCSKTQYIRYQSAKHAFT